MTFGAVLCIVLSIPFVYQIFYHALTLRSCSRPVPAEVSDLYRPEVYRKWIDFRKESSRYHLLCSCAGTAILFLVAGTEILFPVVERLPRTRTALILASTVIHGLLSILSVPFRYYDEMVLKRKYGFCRKSVWAFLKERFLFILAYSFIGFIVSVFFCRCFLADTPGSEVMFQNRISFILPAAGILLLTLFQNLAEYIIREITEKKEDLCEDDLSEGLLELFEELGFNGRIKVAESDTEDNLNAYYTPFGNKIVLYDTLIEGLTEDEICSVVAHEIGHAKHRDFGVSLISDILLKLIGCFAFWVPGNYIVFHSVTALRTMVPFRDACILILIMVLYIPVAVMLTQYRTQRNELAADRVAAECGYGDDLITVLKKAARLDFEDLNPHPLLTALYESHPPLIRRIENIREAE